MKKTSTTAKGKPYRPAIIDLSVTCMGCGAVLYEGAYYPGIINKVNKKIRRNGWIHHPTEGTLCPDCQNKKETRHSV